jgi:hypothetical protein
MAIDIRFLRLTAPCASNRDVWRSSRRFVWRETVAEARGHDYPRTVGILLRGLLLFVRFAGCWLNGLCAKDPDGDQRSPRHWIRPGIAPALGAKPQGTVEVGSRSETVEVGSRGETVEVGSRSETVDGRPAAQN